MTISVDAFQTEQIHEAPAGEAVERLVARGPHMFMDPEEEKEEGNRALEDSVRQAEKQGLSAEGAYHLRDVLTSRVNTFRRALFGDPAARVEPMRVTLKPQAKAVKAKPRRYDPEKTGWLTACTAALMAFGLVVRKIPAVWSSPAMAVPKRDTFRLVSDYHAVNSQIEQSPGVMPSQEDMRELLGANCFGKVDLLQGYWQMPLAPEAQELFTIVTPEGLFTPTRVPQGVLNATSYFQGVMTDLLHDMTCKVWVDGVFYSADSEEALLTLLDEILGRLEV